MADGREVATSCAEHGQDDRRERRCRLRRPGGDRWAAREARAAQTAPSSSPKIDLREPTASPRSEAEPRRRTAARLLTSAVIRRRPSRPHPTSGRRPPGPSFPPWPPTLEDALRWSTASARSEAEPRTRTAALPLTSAAMRSRPSRPSPPPRVPASGLSSPFGPLGFQREGFRPGTTGEDRIVPVSSKT